MKRFKIISIITSFLLLLSTIVLASEPQVIIVGENTVKPSETKTAVVSISNEDIALGVVSGKVEKGTNITNISVSGKNGWNLTYNEATGVFNIYKSTGSKTEEIMNIEYTVSGEEGTAQIILRDVKVTTIDYETKNIGDLTKIITIKNEVVEPEQGEPEQGEPEQGEPEQGEPEQGEPEQGEPEQGEPEQGEPEQGEPEQGEPEQGEPEQGEPEQGEPEQGEPEQGEPEQDKEEGKKEEKPDNKVTTSENTTNKKDNTISSDKKIPQTGEEFYSIAIISILVLITVVSFIGYKKYKIV